MRLVHLSDPHLGYRQYQRLTPTGINQREADVARTFQRAVDRIVELRPDLVLVAGDVFHSSRPSNAAILHAFKQFLRMRERLPETPTIIIAGNHDTPRTSESGSILGLFEQIGVRVAVSESRRFTIPELDTSVLAVPNVPGRLPQFVPDPATRYNVLLIHADVEDVVPRYYAELDPVPLRISRSELGAERWSYIALGHYHVHRRVAGNAFYSGSLDYTSLNVWYDRSEERELGLKGKGFLEVDLATGTHVFHVLPRSREFIEREMTARDMSVAEVDAAIRHEVERVRGGIDDKVVRLIIRDIPRQVTRELDHRVLRDYKRRALSFHLDTRKPEMSRRDVAGSPHRRSSVTEVVRAQLASRPIPPDLARERLIDLGMRYLIDADALPTSGGVVADVER